MSATVGAGSIQSQELYQGLPRGGQDRYLWLPGTSAGSWMRSARRTPSRDSDSARRRPQRQLSPLPHSAFPGCWCLNWPVYQVELLHQVLVCCHLQLDWILPLAQLFLSGVIQFLSMQNHVLCKHSDFTFSSPLCVPFILFRCLTALDKASSSTANKSDRVAMLVSFQVFVECFQLFFWDSSLV